MVLISYQDRIGVGELYRNVLNASCGRQACSVAIMAAHEVDAIASCRMLTTLLKRDNISYSLRPVANYSQVQHCLTEIVSSDIKTVFLINCGARYNIPKQLGNSEIQCIILDSHRPTHLANVHSERQVIVLEHDDALKVERDLIPSMGDDLSEPDDTSNDGSDIDSDNEDSSLDEDEDEDEENESDESSFHEEDGDDVDEDNDEDNEEANDPVDGSADDADEKSLPEGLGYEADAPADDLEDNLETSKEEEDAEEEEGFDRPTGGFIFENEDEDEVKVVGKKRKALTRQYDPAHIHRRQLRSYYDRPAFFRSPTSALMVNIIKIRGVSLSPELMWLAVLGTTDQFLRAHITEDYYNSICEAIKREVAGLQGENKLRVSDSEGEMTVQSTENGRVEDMLDYRFFLYRHWSLYDSMYYSPYVASKLSTWKPRGGEKLQEMLAKIGLPLHECKQSYQFMSPQFRQKFRSLTEDGAIADEFDLKNPGILFHSFSRYTSFKNPVAASDVVYAATALLELCKHDIADGEQAAENSILESQMASFNKAYDALSIRNEELLKEGIQAAINIQKVVVRQAAIMLERPDAIIKVKKFRYSYIYKTVGAACSVGAGSDVESPFARPMVLSRLGHFLMQINKENRKWINRNALPLVLLSERRNSFLVVGLCPTEDAVNMPKLDGTEVDLSLENRIVNFGQNFRLAAKTIHAQFRGDSFDSCVVEVGRDDVHSFIEELFNLMD